ncbi:MAG: coproporphyrinogen dehydrogenase HemZ [Clostridiales bacterium]|nr:coproporphyrinogen dehydrogenase HemZ [Clostridiales bacterium]
MTIRLITPETAFLQDLADILRVFFGDAPIYFGEGGADLVIVHRAEPGLDAFSSGEVSVERPFFAAGRDELERKRLRKRAVKLALYALLKKLTGAHPPWGSLTGIRPSRLYCEALAESLDPVRTLVDVFDVMPDRAELLRAMAGMQKGLRDMPPDAFDLYVGIPFCRTRCAYCSFSSGEIGNGRLVAPYVKALLREIALSAEIVREKGLHLRAGYIGGGTPTAIPRAALEEIFLSAKEAFPGAVEWTVEAGRPDAIDRDMLEMLKSAGATRISVNPQTFSDETLSRIGRAHTGQQAVEAFLLARELGFGDINMDLIAGLPGEALPDFSRTLDRTLGLAPDSITVHALAIKRSSRLHEQMHVSSGGHAQAAEGEAAGMISLARTRLMGAGYLPYYLYRQKYMVGNLENVGYARPGKACLYNIGNMEEVASVLAVGAGAITKWLFDRALRIERAPNVKNIGAYIDRVDEMVERKRRLILYQGGER